MKRKHIADFLIEFSLQVMSVYSTYINTLKLLNRY